MSDVIRLLPDSVANQIAAGEVIQRPASVVKELVENAIDASATRVDIVIKDAGRTLIQVIDDGVGMTDTDARLAFERHSTSKIQSANDLFSLRTMGFRGEALASIAAVSQLELRTCLHGADIGTRVLISASRCESQEPDICPAGSNFQIKNLFFNVPARRKFLKSNAVELANIVKEFEKLALVNPGVEFTLTHNDSMMYKLRAGNFKQRITAIFGDALEKQLLPLAVDTTLVRIDGFVSRPENARRRNSLQYFFVNGRYMRHPYFHKAVMASYEQLIPADTQPNYFLNFTVAPETIDVNIHPTKTEIKFENEAPVWQILSATVKEALGRFSLAPTIDFDTTDAPEIPIYRGGGDIPTPQIDVDPSYNPFNTSKSSTGKQSGGLSSNRQWQQQSRPTMDWEKLYDNFTSHSQQPAITPEASPTNSIRIAGGYIVAPVSSGLMIVDQHRAHLLVLYHRYLRRMSSDSAVSQSLLFPEVIRLTTSQEVILTQLGEQLDSAGFNLANLGNGDWAINGVPAGVEETAAAELLTAVIASVTEGGDAVGKQVEERIALAVARRAAIDRSRMLSSEEADRLLADLMQLPEPVYTPTGKRVIVTLTLDQISSMLG